MYSIELADIAIDEFAAIVKTTKPLPSRRVLPDHISALVPRLKKRDVDNLAKLRRLLQDKSRYTELASDLAVSEEYLVLLNREVNSYVSKPIPLHKLGVLTEPELRRLEAIGISSTKNLYEECAARVRRVQLAHRLEVPEETLVGALEITNLVRINGVGPAFAHLLRDLGIRGPTDFLTTDPPEILQRYEKVNAERPSPGAVLRVEDIEYCQRFCTWLSSDIEW